MASTQTLRKRLSLFAFLDKGREVPVHDGVNPKDTENNDEDCENEAPLSYQPNGQLSSPINSPVSQSIGSLPDADSSIFERSVQDGGFDQAVPKCKRCSGKKSCGHNSSISSSGLKKNEDMVPAALDATTSLLSDDQTNLDQVEMIYPSRRNSSVLSLNMALGRNQTTSRKNSSISMKLGGTGNNGVNMTSPGGSNNGLSSPPRLHSSKSSLSFYSYADMINNDEFARRPSMKHSSTSQGFVPLNKSSFPRYSASMKKAPTSSQLFSQFNNNKLDKFMISPESSDDENASMPSKRKSVSSANSNTNSNTMFNDNESLVSSTVGDCLRKTNTEINGV